MQTMLFSDDDDMNDDNKVVMPDVDDSDIEQPQGPLEVEAEIHPRPSR
jgi:hypothetical protein